jgi:ribosomal protein L12E/L44/L45/RPP1/RPP2
MLQEIKNKNFPVVLENKNNKPATVEPKPAPAEEKAKPQSHGDSKKEYQG